MTARNVFAPARLARRTATCMTAAAALTLGASIAFAQAPAPQVPAPKATPRPAPPKQAQPAQKQPQAPAAQPAAPADQQQQAQGEQPPVVYSPWTKFCGKDNNPQAKEVCLTVKEARLETGQFLAGAALIEQ